MNANMLRKWVGVWVSLCWGAMTKTGKGYRRYSLRRTGVGKDRRGDKRRDIPGRFRSYHARYA